MLEAAKFPERVRGGPGGGCVSNMQLLYSELRRFGDFNTHDSFRAQFSEGVAGPFLVWQGWLNLPNISSNYFSNTKIA